MSNPSITPDAAQWWQWDTGRTVTVAGGTMTECHFANRKQGSAYVQAVINGVARVPDELLQVAAPITAYGYVEDEAGAQTRVEATFEVKARNIPADYTYTKTAQKTIRDAEAARDQAVQAAKDAKGSELAADDSAVEASKSAQSAGDSASAAATSARNAAKSAGEAATSASNAKAAAGKAVEDASILLKTYTDEAKTSADNAATSASNAADAAGAASTSASEASTSASEAATSAQEAKTAAGNAASEVLAATKANADAAAQSATDAATAKAGAETAASNAATSASAAADSAAAAAKSASDAAASVDAINVIAPKEVGIAPVAPKNGIAAGYNASAQSYESVAIGYQATVEETANRSTAIGFQSVADEDETCSVGSAKWLRRVTHVNQPVHDTDASTKHYVDTTTSNALTATVTDTLVTVDDAVVQAPLSLSFKGVARQDGTPSVDKPVKVQVVTAPVVTVAGKNLVNIADKVVEVNSIGEFVPCAVIPANKTVYISMMSSGNASSTYGDAATCGMFDDSEEKATYSVLPDSISTGVNRTTITPKFIATKHFMFYGYRSPRSSFTMTNYQLEVGGYSAYEPYSGQTVAITLPEEHPYLTSLPDGTADEVVIDACGNVTLVARVQKVDVSNLPAPTKTDALDSGLTRYEYWEFVNPPAKLDSAAIAPAFSSVIDYQFKQPGMYVSGTYVVVGAAADPTESLRAGGYLYTTMAEVKAYPLGKVSLPLLKAGVSNVWIDGGMGGAVTMTYKQDANKVIASLKSQIASLTSKAASDEASTSEPTIESDPDYSTGEPTIE